MASQVSHLPHITNVKAAMERWDPVHESVFEIDFNVPHVMQGEYNIDEMLILSQQVLSVDGLDNLQKSIQVYPEKYLGTNVTFIKPTLDNTGVDFNITFNLNLRNSNDVYVFKVFKQWLNLIYSMSTGVVPLIAQARSESIRILEANRDGTVWRQVVIKNVIITGMTGMDRLEYSSTEPRTLKVSFHGDFWDETIG